MAKRIREVFSTSEIAHMWAHHAQLSARNPQGNFSFAGDELRSYSTTIAKRVEHKGTVAFLCLDQTWSNTTAKHQNEMRQATYGKHVYQVTTFPPMGTYAHPQVTRESHKMNVAHMLRRAADLWAKANRARSNRDWLNKEAHSWREMAVRYSALFGVRSVVPSLDDIAGSMAKMSAQAECRTIRERKERQRKEAAERAALMAYVPAALEAWRATGQSNFRDDAGNWLFSSRDLAGYVGHDVLRLNGDNVETSRGAVVPANVVRAIARRLLSVMGTAEAQVYIGRHLGPYAINNITADVVTVGCHQFHRDEIQRIADVLERAEIVPV